MQRVARKRPALRLRSAERLESDVMAEVRQYLLMHPRVGRVIRLNNGAAYAGEGDTRRFIRFCEIEGQQAVRSAAIRPHMQALAEAYEELPPDFVGFMADGRFLAIECKREGWTKPGNRRERGQERFLARVRKAGGVAGFVTSLANLKLLIEG